jgi:hypothetical protein
VIVKIATLWELLQKLPQSNLVFPDGIERFCQRIGMTVERAI